MRCNPGAFARAGTTSLQPRVLSMFANRWARPRRRSLRDKAASAWSESCAQHPVAACPATRILNVSVEVQSATARTPACMSTPPGSSRRTVAVAPNGEVLSTRIPWMDRIGRPESRPSGETSRNESSPTSNRSGSRIARGKFGALVSLTGFGFADKFQAPHLDGGRGGQGVGNVLAVPGDPHQAQLQVDGRVRGGGGVEFEQVPPGPADAEQSPFPTRGGMFPPHPAGDPVLGVGPSHVGS